MQKNKQITMNIVNHTQKNLAGVSQQNWLFMLISDLAVLQSKLIGIYYCYLNY